MVEFIADTNPLSRLPEKAMHPSAEPATILIAEDNEPMRLVVRELLRPEGYLLLEATDGMTALLLAEERLPALVVLDLHLPVLSGIELAERFKGWMPFLVLTVDRQDASVRTCLERGALGYTVKPPDPTAFLLQVRTALARGEEHRQLRQAIQETQRVAKAVGILMMYFDLPEDVAQRALTMCASTERRRAVEVAADVIAAGARIGRFRRSRGQGFAMTPEIVAAFDCLHRLDFHL